MLVDYLQLKRNISSQNLYTLFGEERLLVIQSLDTILSNLKHQGFENKLVFDIETRFDFSVLKSEMIAGDLFASKKIIQLNFNSLLVKNTKEIANIIASIKDGVVVIMVFAKLTNAQQKSKWFNECNTCGLVVNHKEIYANQLGKWVVSQMQNIGLSENTEVAEIIAQNNQGNLLSAFNEIQKLKFIYGSETIDTQEFIKQNTQHSLYSPYSLIDNAMLGNVDKVVDIYNTLKIDSNYLCSLLNMQIKQLIDIHLQLKQKITIATALKNCGVWSSKQSLVHAALKRHSYPILQKILLQIGRTERSIKGRDNKNPQQELLSILLHIAGIKNGLN